MDTWRPCPFHHTVMNVDCALHMYVTETKIFYIHVYIYNMVNTHNTYIHASHNYMCSMLFSYRVVPPHPMGLQSAPLARAGQRQSVVMASLMKHTLNNNHRRSPSGISRLVQLASQGSSSGSCNLPVSPVIVRLSALEDNKLSDNSK